MLDIKEARMNLRQSRNDICRQISDLLIKRDTTLAEIERYVPLQYIHLQHLMLGRFDISLSQLNQIARYFDKKIKIELVD